MPYHLCGLTFSFALDTQTIPNIFAHSDPSTDPSTIGAVPPRFGLLDDSKDRWAKLDAFIYKLDAEGGDEVHYKLIWAGRHGEGFHNVAEAKYGTKVRSISIFLPSPGV